MNRREPPSLDIGNPSTPPPLRSRRPLSASETSSSSRPLPPWPVSPGPYSTPISPQTNHHHRQTCPGAPRKNRYSRDNERNHHDVLGIVPRRLDFGADANFETDEPPILLSPPPPPPPSPRTPLSHEDPSFPVLGMRPFGRKGLSMDSMGVVPDNSPATTPQRASNLERAGYAQSPSSSSSNRDCESEWQR